MYNQNSQLRFMKVIFICGSLEPGKDGVGDYTRRLCVELQSQGVKVAILAYNDKYIHTKMECFQSSEGQDILCLRLPHSSTDKHRLEDSKKWISQHNTEWLSLQFVPYAFNNKGLPFGLGSRLKDMGRNCKWHVMIHELWIGMSHQSSFKEKCIGYIQKKVIKDLLLKLAPKVIHTQTDLYQYHLQKLGFQSSILPLFSNIPFVKSDPLQSDINSLDLPDNYLVVFGSIHKKAPIEDFVRELHEWDSDKIFSFIALGRNGGELEHWASVFEKYGFKVRIMGEQSVETISYVLNNATYGLATTPYYLVEKSGSVAAMHEHQLPVICFSKPWQPIKFNRKNRLEGVMEYKIGNLKACMDEAARVNADKISISNVAKAFLNTLKT